LVGLGRYVWQGKSMLSRYYIGTNGGQTKVAMD